MKIQISEHGKKLKIDPMIYGQFIEHFHRQIYGGVYDPKSRFADEDGFRIDVLEAMKRIQVPILRWPGGCFASAYHWKYGVGPDRKPAYDKAWRVEEPNTFGTDEYIKLCRKLGCQPYICTNAGTGTAEEMSDWVEYCNLKHLGTYSRWREENGFPEPHEVKFWSIGNENYGHWEIGAKTAEEWGHLVTESAKMMKRVDPTIELSAAALADMDWNTQILKNAGERLDWLSIHGYWDFHEGKNHLADYETCMQYTEHLEDPVRQVRGLLDSMNLHHIRIAYDEWNLRAWYHPNIMDLYQGKTPEEYLYPRNENDINSQYTMADAVFSACFLNMCIRNCDLIGMAAFSPVVNTRGMIFTYSDGIVLRSTYYVFDAYVNEMEKYYTDAISIDNDTDKHEMEADSITDNVEKEPLHIDYVATSDKNGKRYSIALVNRDSVQEQTVEIHTDLTCKEYQLITVNGPSKDSYNDIDHTEVKMKKTEVFSHIDGEGISVKLEPHSVNILKLWECSY